MGHPLPWSGNYTPNPSRFRGRETTLRIPLASGVGKLHSESLSLPGFGKLHSESLSLPGRETTLQIPPASGVGKLHSESLSLRGRETTPRIPLASGVGKLHPESRPQPLPGDVEGFGQHSRFANHRHEVGIAEPTGEGMHMEMWGNAGSGGLA
jgi:hypothetical protein